VTDNVNVLIVIGARAAKFESVNPLVHSVPHVGRPKK